MKESSLSDARDKPNILFVIGAILLLLINTVVSWSFADTNSEVAGQVGAALVPTFVVLIVYGIARALGKGGTRSAKARIAFWTMTVVFVSHCGQQSVRMQEHRMQQAARTDAKSELNQTRETGNGLVVVRYPSDFAATSQGDNVIFVVRGQEGVLFMGIARPVSPDLHEVSRVIMIAEDKNMNVVKELSNGDARCFNNLPGVERTQIVRLSGVPEESFRWECIFLNNGHAFGLSYAVDTKLRGADEPILRRIVAATVIK